MTFTNWKNDQKRPGAIQQEQRQSMIINTNVRIIRIGKSKVHSAKEKLGVLMNHETVMSAFSIAAWHRKVVHKEAARHMQTVSL